MRYLKISKKGFMHALEAVLAIFLLMFYAGEIMKTPAYMKTFESESAIFDLKEQVMGLLTSLDNGNLLGETIFSGNFQMLTKTLRNILPEQASFSYSIVMMQPFSIYLRNSSISINKIPITISLDFPVAVDRNSLIIKDDRGFRVEPIQIEWPWIRHRIDITYRTVGRWNWEKNITVVLRTCDNFAGYEPYLFAGVDDPCVPYKGDGADFFEFEPRDINNDGSLEYPDKNSIRVYLEDWYDPRLKYRIPLYIRANTTGTHIGNATITINFGELMDRQHIAPTIGIDLNSTIITDKYGTPVNYTVSKPVCNRGPGMCILDDDFKENIDGEYFSDYNLSITFVWTLTHPVTDSREDRYYLYFTTFDLEPDANFCDSRGRPAPNITYYNCKKPQSPCIDNICCEIGRCSFSDCRYRLHTTQHFYTKSGFSSWCPRKNPGEIIPSGNIEATYGSIEFYSDRDYIELPVRVEDWRDGRVFTENNEYNGITILRKPVKVILLERFDKPGKYIKAWRFELEIIAHEINRTVELGGSILGMEVVNYLNEYGKPDAIHSCEYLWELTGTPCLTIEKIDSDGDSNDDPLFRDFPQRPITMFAPGYCDNGNYCNREWTSTPQKCDGENTGDISQGCPYTCMEGRCLFLPSPVTDYYTASQGSSVKIYNPEFYICISNNATCPYPPCIPDKEDRFLMTITVPQKIVVSYIDEKLNTVAPVFNHIKNLRINIPLSETTTNNAESNWIKCPGMTEEINDIPELAEPANRLIMLHSGETLEAIKSRSELNRPIFNLYPSSYGRVYFELPYLEVPDLSLQTSAIAYEITKRLYIYYSLGTDKNPPEKPDAPYCGSPTDPVPTCSRQNLYFIKYVSEAAPRADISWFESLEPGEKRDYFAFYSIGTHTSPVLGKGDLRVIKEERCKDCYIEPCRLRKCRNGIDDNNNGKIDEFYSWGLRSVENSYLAINYGGDNYCPIKNRKYNQSIIDRAACKINTITWEGKEIDTIKFFDLKFKSLEYNLSLDNEDCIEGDRVKKQAQIITEGPVFSSFFIDYFDDYIKISDKNTFFSYSPFFRITREILPKATYNDMRIYIIYSFPEHYSFSNLTFGFVNGSFFSVYRNRSIYDNNIYTENLEWLYYWNETCEWFSNTPCGFLFYLDNATELGLIKSKIIFRIKKELYSNYTRLRTWYSFLHGRDIDAFNYITAIQTPIEVIVYNKLPLSGGNYLIERELPKATSTATASYVVTTNGRKRGYAWVRLHLWYG